MSIYNFRRYKKVEGGKKKKAKHPKLIVDENQREYGFMGLTESKKRGHHNNIPLHKNPQKGNKNKSYLRTELRYDDKGNFGKVLSDYKLSNIDKIKVKEFVEKKKK